MKISSFLREERTTTQKRGNKKGKEEGREGGREAGKWGRRQWERVGQEERKRAQEERKRGKKI